MRPKRPQERRSPDAASPQRVGGGQRRVGAPQPATCLANAGARPEPRHGADRPVFGRPVVAGAWPQLVTASARRPPPSAEARPATPVLAAALDAGVAKPRLVASARLVVVRERPQPVCPVTRLARAVLE